jgi:putative transposase
MRQSRFTEEQIFAALKEHAPGTPAIRLRRTAGGWEWGEDTLYRWKHRHGGMEVSEARRLRAYGEQGGELVVEVLTHEEAKRRNSNPMIVTTVVWEGD